MKKTLIIPLALLALFRPATSFADNELSVGVGIGALYSGIGVNAALKGDNHIGYVSAGCIGIGHSDNSGWILPCGIGAGWIWTNLLTNANNRHGIGLYAGPVGMNEDDKARYGVGITYVYFLQGVKAKGWHFGITPAIGKENGDTKGSLLINAGYQF